MAHILRSSFIVIDFCNLTTVSSITVTQSTFRNMLLSLTLQVFHERMFGDYGTGLGDALAEAEASGRAQGVLRYRSSSEE